MKHLIFCVFVFLMLASPAWAARTPLAAIAKDPYVSALVIDADSGKTLFEADADAKVYPASVLKLMDLYVILDRIERGQLRLDEMVQVTPEASKTGGSQVYLDPKEQFPVEELLYALMVQSANDAAVALATHIAGSKEGFVALMNEKARALGMHNTRFHSVHGLPPSEGQEPDVTTARDFAILCRELVKRPEALKYTATQTRGFRDDKFIMRNHNKLLAQVSGCDGLKTGYYQAAGFSIASTAKKGGVRIIALVMGSKDRKVRDAQATALIGKGFALIPPKPGQTAAAANPVAQRGQNPTAVTYDASSPLTESPSAAPPDAANARSAPRESGDWGKFFIGLGLGFVLFLGVFVIAGFLIKKRSGSVRSKYKNRG